MKRLFIYVLLLFLLSSCTNNTNNTAETKDDISIDDSSSLQENIIKDYDDELGVGINQNNFPDKEFIKYIKNIDIDNNDYLSSEEINNFKSLNINNNNKIENIDGIEFLSNLEEFICYNCKNLSSINIDSLRNIKVLSLSSLPISSINLSNNLKIEKIGLYGTNIDNIKIYGTSNPISIGVGVQRKNIVIDISNCPYFVNNVSSIIQNNFESPLYIDLESESSNFIEIVCDGQILKHTYRNIDNKYMTYLFGQGDNNTIVNTTFNTYDEAFDYGFNGNKWFEIVTHPYKDGTECTLKDCWTNPESCTYQYEVIVYDEQPF